MTASVFELHGNVQSYDWGSLGKHSKVAHFAKEIPGFQYDADKPYAELWMGTHPSLPSKLAADGSSLKDHLHINSHLLGDAVPAQYGSNDLPFLFKVLAIGKALSIQAHPDKKLAKQLFKEKPDIYKDENHKPEMAIALTDFSGFCGFRPLPQISDCLKSEPEFAAVVGQSAASSFQRVTSSATQSLLAKSPPAESPSPEYSDLQTALRDLFSALMHADPETTVKPQLRKLVQRYKTETGKTISQEMKYGTIAELVVRLDEQFPNDVGAFCAFMLNVVDLKKGEAIFLKANEPHAYLSGDNVVRAGLTPKLRDVPTLTSMLTYTYGPSDSQLMVPKPFRTPSKHTKEYNPPIDEFSVLLIDTISSGSELHPALDGPSIVIVTELNGTGEFKHDGGVIAVKREGQTFFVAAGTQLEFRGKMIAYRAYVEVEN
ncbi:MAG: Mannose-6-phosphate isomerase [Cyphobasidiales sp. Tagirdzhanova-0007]|nr:MAG: Mannose-6-phosphate isomerase [Cyphobasidiales sp. Tagirdzhanova-0007]